MESSVGGSAVQRLHASLDSTTVYKLALAVLLAVMMATLLFRPNKRNNLPIWAAVEIALPHAVGAVEANLQNLTRDFGACDAIPLHYGQDFFDRCSQILADFWRFDTDIFPLSLIGIPPWAPFQIMRKRVAARRRFLEGTTALYRRIDQYQCGETVESGVDMSDISKVALERRWVYSSMGEASKKVKPVI
ncbi:hypothetical protein LTR75_002639 [Friedmanniomyces endolithicus]|nr:hypothetical protein LTR75_002639 [Friedmanniomyces endolithicus]